MRFADSDYVKNTVTALSDVRVGATGDARWRGVTSDTIDRLDVQEIARSNASCWSGPVPTRDAMLKS